MRFRKLRIAWSVFWGVVAVLLVVLWVRSFTDDDDISGPLSAYRVIGIGTGHGRIRFDLWRYEQPHGVSWHTDSVVFVGAYDYVSPNIGGPSLGIYTSPSQFELWFPIWLTTVGASAISGAPSLRWHYSLRTLLIATTLIAALLGLAVYASR